MRTDGDPTGHAIKDYYDGRIRGKFEVIETRDGRCNYSNGPEAHFRTLESWSKSEQSLISYAQGEVLDLACGAGRCGLHLQDLGISVTAIDLSRLAVQVCRQRGLNNAMVGSFWSIPIAKRFDTILLLGNGLSLVEAERMNAFLCELSKFMKAGARFIASSIPGAQFSGDVRTWYKQHRSPWFRLNAITSDVLFSSLSPNGWSVIDTSVAQDAVAFVLEWRGANFGAAPIGVAYPA